MASKISVKPWYTGLLARIGAGESKGGDLFAGWAATTPDPDLREVLDCVALRERDHGDLFCTRLAEMGCTMTVDEDDSFSETLAMLRSDAGDQDKMACFDGWVRGEFAKAKAAGGPRLDKMLDDDTVDPVTRSLLRWFIDEEKDSGRLLEPLFNRLRQSNGSSNGSSDSSGGGKPAYLGLLNGIAVAEGRGGLVLDAWAAATPDADLAEVLRFVAAREHNHHDVFAARVDELGFGLREAPDPGLDERIAFYASDASDADKVDYGRKAEKKRSAKNGGAKEDPLAGLEARMADPGMDTVTRHLLRWFVDEERDSGARLQQAYSRVRKAGART
jgi:rubrerythrin